MAVVATANEFLSALKNSGILNPQQIADQLAGLPEDADATTLARAFVRAGLITKFQARCLAQGKWRNLIIADKYKILDFLGDGGMGQVFLAEHQLMKRQVALKVPPAKKMSEKGMAERFVREARALAALDHPNIVRAHDLEKWGGLYMLAMEYVDGPNLRDYVSEHGPRPIGQAAHYIAQAAQGLQHAHEAGWVHRDIKPANLLVDPAGVVKVLDLGLAFLLGDDAESPTRKFDESNVLGTADYLAPEQAIDSHEVDIRADIYSLGATMYFLLTGRPIFDCSTVAQKLVAHQMKEPTPIRQLRPDVPPALARILNKMIAKSPAERYQTPAEVAEALMPFASNAEVVPPHRKGRTHTPRKVSDRSLASTIHSRSRMTGVSKTWLELPQLRNRKVLAGVVGGGLAGLILTIFVLILSFSGRHNASAAGGVNVPASPARTNDNNPVFGAFLAQPFAGERLIIQAHRGNVECVRFLPDRRLITCGDDKLIRIWDPKGQQVLKQLSGHTEIVRCVALIPGDPKHILSAARDGTLRLWDIDAGIETRRFIGHIGHVWWGDVSADGRYMISGGQDKTVRLWDFRTAVELKRFTGHTDIVTCVAFLPDGKRAISCSTDKSARIWNLENGSEINALALPDRAYRLTLAPGDSAVAIGSRSSVQAWDYNSDKVTTFDSSLERGAYIEQGRFSPDGRWLLASASDGAVRMWDVANRRELPIKRGFRGKTLEVCWAPDGKSYAVTCSDGTVRFWDWNR